MNQESIKDYLIEHSHSPKNGRFPGHAHYKAQITNPLCGDHVELRIHSEVEHLQDIGFKTSSCAICSASASILSEVARGKSRSEALASARLFEQALTEARHAPWPSELLALSCFEHLRVNPSRRMCALLPWVVLKSALHKKESI